MLLLGDSVTAQCTEGSNDWYYLANVASGRPLRPAPAGTDRNQGEGSNTTTQMFARFAVDVLAVGTDWLIIFGGLNDIGAFGSSPQTSEAIANLSAMYDQALAAGMKLIAATVYPSDFMTTQAQKDGRAELNAAIAAYVASHDDIYLCDWAPVMESSPDVLNAAYSDDGVHPNAAGASAMAGVLDDALVANVAPV